MAQINSGIDKIVAIQNQQAAKQRARAVGDLRNKLYTLLVGIPGYPVGENQQFCHSLEQMDSEQRRQAIIERFGGACLTRVEPLLQQLGNLGI